MYSVHLVVYTHKGDQLAVRRLRFEDFIEGQSEEQRRQRARREATLQWLEETAIKSGVRLEVEIKQVVTAYEARPGTWVLLPAGWRQVDHWEPVDGVRCRLVTTDRVEPHGGVYERDHEFETR